MRNKYGNILVAHISDRVLFWTPACMFVFGLIMAATWISAVLPLFISPLLTYQYVWVVIAKLKRQITTPNATFIPNYRVPHLIVAALLLLPVLFLMPFAASLPHMGPYPPPRAVAIPHSSLSSGHGPATQPDTVTLVFDPAPNLPPFHYFPLFVLALVFIVWLGWASYKASVAMTFIATASCFSNAVPLAHRFLSHLLEASFPIEAVVLCIATLVAGAVLVRRFLLLTEEMPEYHPRNLIGWSGKLGQPQINALGVSPSYSSRWQTVFFAKNGRLIDDLSFIATPSLTQRINRWRIAGNDSRDRWLLGLLFAGPSLVASFYFGRNAALLIMCVYIWPTMITLATAYVRRARLGYQSLYPISRSRLLKDHALLLAYEWSQVWFPIAAAYVIGTMVATDHPPTSSFIMWMIIATVGQGLVVAITLWMLSFFSFPFPWLCGIVYGLSIALGPFPTTIGPTAFLIIAAILLILMILILHSAYHRWLTTELA
jgi:hypothetical protein